MNELGRESMEIDLGVFQVRIRFIDETRLKLQVVGGDEDGYEETVNFVCDTITSDVRVLSWREHTGTTVVHVIDPNDRTHCYVTTPSSQMMHLKGVIRSISI